MCHQKSSDSVINCYLNFLPLLPEKIYLFPIDSFAAWNTISKEYINFHQRVPIVSEIEHLSI